MHRWKLVGLTVVLFAGGCAVPDYKEPLNEFAKATENAETALGELNSHVTSAYSEQIRAAALNGNVLVRFKKDSCLTGSERCELSVLRRDGSTEPLTPDPALRRMISLMSGIRAYSKGLADIANSETATATAVHVNATVGSIGALAETVAKHSAGPKTKVDFQEYATPIGELVNWVVGNYVARVKIDGLRRATRDAKPVVAEAGKLFETAAGVAAFIPRQSMAEAVSVRRDAFDANPTEANLDRLLQSAAAYDQWLVAKPSGVFGSLVAAHNALADKLQAKEVSLATVIAEIKAFAAEVKAVSAILKSISEAGKDKG